MAIYYADFDLATGNNDGTTAANAWQTMQRAVDGTAGTQPTAGDIVYCTGTDTLGANLDLDGLTGDITSGMVRWIGVSDLTPTNDGTRAVIDGGNTYTCTATATDYWYFENFEFTQMLTAGIESATSPDFWFFLNCSFNNNGAEGINCVQLQFSLFVRCSFYANTTDGVLRAADNTFYFCSLHDNTGSGVNFGPGSLMQSMIGCLIYDNGGDGLEGLPQKTVVFNCVINGNTNDGIVGISSAGLRIVIGNRITNNGVNGIDGINEIVLHGWNYYEDNVTANRTQMGISYEILDDGATTEVEDQADTNEGYTNKGDGAEDFNLRSDATSRRTAITIPTV